MKIGTIISLFVVGVFIAISNFNEYFKRQDSKTCRFNLLAIKGAKFDAMERQIRSNPDLTHINMSGSHLLRRFGGSFDELPECPSGGEYNIGAHDEDPTCTTHNK